MSRNYVASRRGGMGCFIAAVDFGRPAAGFGSRALKRKRQRRQVTLAVTSLMRTEHLTRHPLDSEIADRTLILFLKTLDPWKLYFNQADVDHFMAQKDELIRQVRRGDISLGYEIFRTFLKRADERVKIADEYLAGPHDFTVDEEMVSDPDAAKYATGDTEARDLWRTGQVRLAAVGNRQDHRRSGAEKALAVLPQFSEADAADRSG